MTIPEDPGIELMSSEYYRTVPGFLGRIRIYMQAVNKHSYRYMLAVDLWTENALKNPRPSTYSAINNHPELPEARICGQTVGVTGNSITVMGFSPKSC